MIQLILLIGAAMIAGAIGGTFAARWLIRRNQRRQVQPQPAVFSDPALNTEIDRAAAVWANSHGRPEAASLAADKMHLIHRISQRRGWWS